MALHPDKPASSRSTSPRHEHGDTAAHYTIRLGQIFPLLADAVANGRAWLTDFSDEPVQVSEDLYDVILAYQHFQEM